MPGQGNAEEGPLSGEGWEGFLKEGAFEQGRVDIPQAETGTWARHAGGGWDRRLRGVNKAVCVWKSSQQKR